MTTTPDLIAFAFICLIIACNSRSLQAARTFRFLRQLQNCKHRLFPSFNLSIQDLTPFSGCPECLIGGESNYTTKVEYKINMWCNYLDFNYTTYYDKL